MAPAPDAAPVSRAKFDRNAYQRELMRKRRALGLVNGRGQRIGPMRVTLAEYQRLTPEERRRVTHIDAAIVDPDLTLQTKIERKRERDDDQWDREHEAR